jgi:hypothetical protein
LIAHVLEVWHDSFSVNTRYDRKIASTLAGDAWLGWCQKASRLGDWAAEMKQPQSGHFGGYLTPYQGRNNSTQAILRGREFFKRIQHFMPPRLLDFSGSVKEDFFSTQTAIYLDLLRRV